MEVEAREVRPGAQRVQSQTKPKTLVGPWRGSGWELWGQQSDGLLVRHDTLCRTEGPEQMALNVQRTWKYENRGLHHSRPLGNCYNSLVWVLSPVTGGEREGLTPAPPGQHRSCQDQAKPWL